MTRVNDLNGRDTPKILIVRHRNDMATGWGFVLKQQGANIILEPSLERTVDRWKTEMPDRVRNCSM